MTNKIDIMDYMIDFEVAKDFYELVEAMHIEDIHSVLDEEDFMNLLQIKDFLKGDEEQVQFWGTLDKLLSSKRPPIEYTGVIRDDNLESIMKTCNTHTKYAYSKKLNEFMSQFKNLRKSPMLSMLFFVLYDYHIDEIEINQMEQDGRTEDEIMEYLDEKDIGNVDFNYAVEVIFPSGYSIDRMNDIVKVVIQDDNEFNDDIQDIYFMDSIDMDSSVKLEIIASDFLEFAEYIDSRLD